jgi:hypothetical protein
MVSTRHRGQMRATLLSRADNRRLGLDHNRVTQHQYLNFNYNGVADKMWMSLTVSALPDVFVLGDPHI